MLKILIGLLILGVLATLLYIMPIQVKLKTLKKNEDDFVLVETKTLYGIVKLKFEIPLLDVVFVNKKPALKYKAELESSRTNRIWKTISKTFSIDDFEKIKAYFHHDHDLFIILKNYWLKVTFINDLLINIRFGLGDAALAAILYGTAWTLLGSFLALIEGYANLKTKNISITPCFDKAIFNVEFSCIIKFKFGNIINTGIMVLKRRRELKKKSMHSNNTLKAI